MVVGQFLEKLASHDVGAIAGHNSSSDDNCCGVPEQCGPIAKRDAEVAAEFIARARQEMDAALPKVDYLCESRHGVADLDDRAGECLARR